MSESNEAGSKGAGEEKGKPVVRNDSLTGALTLAQLQEIRKAMDRGDPIPGVLSRKHIETLGKVLDSPASPQGGCEQSLSTPEQDPSAEQ
jgi:hypothetical protein